MTTTEDPTAEPAAGRDTDGGADPAGARAAMADYAVAKYGRDLFNDFDIHDPKFNEHFEEVLDDMVTRCPVARSNVGDGYWVFSRLADLRRIGQDWKGFRSGDGAFQIGGHRDSPYLLPEESDPPVHTAWRQAINPYMSPKALAQYEEAIRSDANTLIDTFIGNGRCEFVSEFGAKLPGWAFFKNVLGVPIDDLGMLVEGVEQGSFAPPEERAAYLGRVWEYLGAYLARRATQAPRGDLVDMIAAGVDYGTGEPCSFEDRVAVLVTVTFGGISTTTNVLSSGMRYLATHPEERALLVARPELIPRAVEEFVRVFPPAVGLGRRCAIDTQVAGQSIQAGDWVLMLYAGASRDPAAIDNPTQVDITRESVMHSAFGVGPHRCLGSNLARLELRVSFEELLRRMPHFSLGDDEPALYETGMIRNMRALRLVF